MTASQQDIQEMQTHLKGLAGQKAWGVLFSPYSFLTLEFGQPGAPTSEHEPAYGEWHLWLYSCEWRLEEKDDAKAASQDARTKVEREIQRLNGRILEAFEIITPAFDAVLTFEGEMVLRLFSVKTEGEDQESWILFTPDTVLLVGPGGNWKYGQE